MLDAAGNPVIIDALISSVPERMISDVPEIARASQEANRETEDQTGDLFGDSEPSAVARVENWADRTIAANKGQLLSGVPEPALLAAFAAKVSFLLARGIRDF